ncbi:MAG: TIGR00730 family Rossman fold protein [Actinomycetota bacterium]
MTQQRKKRRYSTGVEELDQRIAELVAETDLRDRDGALISEIVITALLLGKDAASRLDLKIVNAALKEMRYAFRVFSPYRDVKKVSVFGSARSKPGDPDYEQARTFGRTIAEHGWMVVTGAGPGSMEAANEGAGVAKSFGVNIRLPFEAEPNPVIADDPKLINFKYFFTRKLMFIKEASAFVLLPGGFGTMDEAFELLTLIQTGKSDMHPVVLLDPPGGTYWKHFVEFIQRDLIDRGYVTDTDLRLLTVTDDVDEAAAEIARFYANYDSMRFIGQRLILRLKKAPDDTELARLSTEFADLLDQGVIERSEPSPVEVEDADALDMQRIRLYFDRASLGRLRMLIDELKRLSPQQALPRPGAPDA